MNTTFTTVKVQQFKTQANPFSGINFVNHYFNKSGLSSLIDNELGGRGRNAVYSYSDILRNLCNVALSGGSVIEDINSHFREHLESIPNNKVPSADTLLRAITELTTTNTVYTSQSGNTYDFNINLKMNRLLVKSLKLTGQLQEGEMYDFDYDNQINANHKWDAKRTYKKNEGYLPGIATIGNKIVYIENRDGNANVKFKQEDTLERAYTILEEEGIKINRSRMDAGSYSKEIIKMVNQHSELFYIRANKSENLFQQINQIKDWETIEINHKQYQVASIPFKQFFEEKGYRLVIMREKAKSNQLDLFTQDSYIYRSILTNDHNSTEKEVIEFYNQRGASEKTFDVMNNDFWWKHLPFSFLSQNNTFMIVMALLKNFYNYLIVKISSGFPELDSKSRLKKFIFRFVTVAGKWVWQSRTWILKLYTRKPYHLLV